MCSAYNNPKIVFIFYRNIKSIEEIKLQKESLKDKRAKINKASRLSYSK